jgi:serine/threonine-protein kinase
MPLAPGESLQNRYRIVARLGAGGMGAVYRAWDRRLDVAVAVKEMVPQPGLDSQTLANLRRQFQREAQILARLNHPNLVRVTDFFQERGNAYLVMDLVEGESLAEQIQREQALSESRVLRLAEHLLDALVHCHSQGVIHRDIKPQNVIIRPDGDQGAGSAVMVDFGLVKLWDPQDPRTKTAVRGMGTPEYAPPEQYSFTGHTDARSDIYSLGATLYHALTGRAPATATDRISSRNAFTPPRALNRGISPRTEAVVLQAMELMVEDRFQSAKEMKAALRKASEGAKTGRSAIPLWVWSMGGVAVIGVLALILGLALSWPGGEDEGTPVTPERTVVATVPLVATEADLAGTATPVASAIAPTSADRHTSTPAATATGADDSTPTATPSRSPEPTLTPTPTPSATSEPQPTATSAPVASAPQLVAPAQGGTYQSPVTFEWQGSLQPGQAYQVVARHEGSGATAQSGPITQQSWTADLPGDKFGGWIWSVSVVQNGTVMATSSEWSFWFNPHPGGDDGGGGGNGGDGDGSDGPQPTPTR